MTESRVDVERLSKKEIEEIARRVVRNLGEYVPASFQRLLRKLGKAIEAGIRANHRRMLVISGEDPVLVGALAARGPFPGRVSHGGEQSRRREAVEEGD